MRKFSLILCGVLLVTTLTGCSNIKISKIEDTNIEISTEVSETVHESIDTSNTEVIQNTENDKEVVIYTQEKYDTLKTYLESFNYLEVTQIDKSGYRDLDIYKETTYNIKADTTNKVTFLETLYTNEMKEEHKCHIFRDEATGLICNFDYQTGLWKEADGAVDFVNWNLIDFTSTFDVYKFLVKNFELPINTEGELIENYEHYTIVTDTNPSLLKGIEYDSLGKQTVSYIYQQLDGVSVPSSITVEVEYLIGDTVYYITSTLQFTTFKNYITSIPEYTKLN